MGVSTKVLVIIVLIGISAFSAIVGVSLVYKMNNSTNSTNSTNPTNSTNSSPILTIDSLSLTPGLTEAPIGPYAYTNYYFSYTIHANLTIIFKEPMKVVYTGFDPCSIGLTINSSSWHSYPIIYYCPLILASPTLTIKAGIYNTSIISEIMSKSSIPTYPSTVIVKASSGIFNTISSPTTLTLTSHGVQYMYAFNGKANQSKPLTNGSSSIIVHAGFYYESDQAITISNCSKFNLIVNPNMGQGSYEVISGINNWSFTNISVSLGNNVTLSPGGTLINISASLYYYPARSIYFNHAYLPNHLPMQIVYNQKTVVSNIIGVLFNTIS